jgi:small subunit ribosomal protein S6
LRKYELTYLISDEISESDLNKVTGKVAGYIAGLGGEINKEEIWGRRKLAYPIRKQDFATYVTIFFGLPADKVKEFDREMRLTQAILRHLLIVTEFNEEKLALSAEDIAAAQEIAEVAGGEKSFEAIEGETKDSKKLMSVREEAPKAEIVEKEMEVVEEPKKEKAPKTTAKKEVKKEIAEPEVKEEVIVEKVEKVAKAPVKKVAKKDPNDEAERLSKLNDELDDILKDEL